MVDISRLPLGDRGWIELIRSLNNFGDLKESDYLELKGELDFSRAEKAKSYAKIAKYVLGSANRSVEDARRHLDGHGVMLIGVDNDGEVIGVDVPDPEQVDEALTQLLGPKGPNFDLTTVKVDDKYVLIVIVPHAGYGHFAFPCRKTSADLVDGHIYVRVPGKTRQATSAEIDMLVQRGLASADSSKIDVTFTEPAYAVDDQHTLQQVRSLIDRIAVEMQSDAEENKDSRGFFDLENRSLEEFKQEMEFWRAEAYGVAPDLVREVQVRLLPLAAVTVNNGQEKALRSVELELTLPQSVVVFHRNDSEQPWEDGNLSSSEVLSWLPKLPIAYRDESALMRTRYSPQVPLFASRPFQGVSDLAVKGQRITFQLGDLRPDSHVASEADLFLLYRGKTSPDHLVVPWSLTAADMHVRLRSTTKLNVRPKDSEQT